MFGLQLYANIWGYKKLQCQWAKENHINKKYVVQRLQNRVLRCLTKTAPLELSTEQLLDTTNNLSVHQLAAVVMVPTLHRAVLNGSSRWIAEQALLMSDTRTAHHQLRAPRCRLNQMAECMIPKSLRIYNAMPRECKVSILKSLPRSWPRTTSLWNFNSTRQTLQWSDILC